MDNKLTDNHRRTLSITAQTVDETVNKIEKLLDRFIEPMLNIVNEVQEKR